MGDTIAERMVAFLNEWPQKPAEIRLGMLQKTAPAMMMRPLSGATRAKTFVDGSFVGRWPFAVFIRTGGEDARERLNADAALHALAAWLERAEMPQLPPGQTAIRVEMAQSPAIAAAFNSGAEDYMAVFSLEYREVRNG